MTPDEKRRLVSLRTDWFHSIAVGDGITTPGVVSVEYEEHLLKSLQISTRLDELRVLDIGTYDGFYAFEAERRGAREVVAIDVNPIDCRCFKLASDLLESKVKYHHMSVYEMDEQVLGGKFDLVLFPGSRGVRGGAAGLMAEPSRIPRRERPHGSTRMGTWQL